MTKNDGIKRVFSGVQPSGDLHIGNYIGALSQWAKNQDQYENFFCVVDLHAITIPTDPKELKEQTKSITAWYIAAGIDPTKSTIFIQSHNKDHAHLAWILNCYTSMGQLSRMTQYKEKKEKIKFVSVGLFDYPVLMAADILLYDADLVPVGEDQKQHVELTRDVAERFNKIYGEVFVLPEYMPPPSGERIMSLQNPQNKMAKSEADIQGTIYLEDDPDTIQEKVMSAVTDSGNEIRLDPQKPAISNLITIFMALSGKSAQELNTTYSGQGYQKFKQDLTDLVIETLLPLQEKYKKIRESEELEDVLTKGLEHVQKISSLKLEEVQKIIGFG